VQSFRKEVNSCLYSAHSRHLINVDRRRKEGTRNSVVSEEREYDILQKPLRKLSL
jgi:hypothetical protein